MSHGIFRLAGSGTKTKNVTITVKTSNFNSTNILASFVFGPITGGFASCSERIFAQNRINAATSPSQVSLSDEGSNDGNTSFYYEMFNESVSGTVTGTWGMTFTAKVIPGQDYEVGCGTIAGKGESIGSFTCTVQVESNTDLVDPDGDSSGDGDGEETSDGDESTGGDESSGGDEETECAANFTTLGMQPVAGVLQDDKHFKEHSILVGEGVKDFGETINYAITENDAKDLIKDRFRLAVPRNPAYRTKKNLQSITFFGDSSYTTNKEAQLVVTANDPSGEVLNYEHKQTVTGPFTPPCGESQPFSVTFLLDQVFDPWLPLDKMYQ